MRSQFFMLSSHQTHATYQTAHVQCNIFLLMGSKLELMHCREHGLSLRLTLVIAHCPIFTPASLSHLNNILMGAFEDKVEWVTRCKNVLNALK